MEMRLLSQLSSLGKTQFRTVQKQQSKRAPVFRYECLFAFWIAGISEFAQNACIGYLVNGVYYAEEWGNLGLKCSGGTNMAPKGSSGLKTLL
jgi:hypothetical protein